MLAAIKASYVFKVTTSLLYSEVIVPLDARSLTAKYGSIVYIDKENTCPVEACEQSIWWREGVEDSGSMPRVMDMMDIWHREC